MKHVIWIFLLSMLALPFACRSPVQEEEGVVEGPPEEGSIRPWSENPFYWEFQGAPVLLVGGSDDDNLFQWPDQDLKEQLDLHESVGGNYVRNTMSDRRVQGFEVYPFAEVDGVYDLERWNPKYWRRFERFLEWTAERDIFVQIEIWDRFDYSRENWPGHPYNPQNNRNYTFEESGLEAEYPAHPGRNEQPFFFTTPEQQNNEVLLRYQQRFVEKLLSYSLQHPHILYCMDNETSGEAAWGRYWAEFVKEKAKEAGRSVAVTEMWDDWDLRGEEHRRTFDHPELYDFVDVSQNNHNSGELHWENALWVRRYLSDEPRPINTVKTYGADENKFGHSDQDGIERFWRHLLAGVASARFHRPPSGLGLGKKAQDSIRAVRLVESLVRFWTVEPHTELLLEREENEAYLAAAPGEAYILYFPKGGEAALEVPAGVYQLRWLELGSEDWSVESEATSQGLLRLLTPAAGHWIAVLSSR